ncbi:leucyl/phenylalanyl-tRNA--protein transferase [Rhodoferax sp.]|uniref:leucyl/phenylalanyl-tRNA--protein transferase n=1 Tax=Rhodoferax sp. TaxID=50421 RepID=UPI00284CAF85|nr:leucyl/phenylalanyl-tRNA--protein transferase [Rhodoferax sp.]MDR3369436.1 leucyl/phenylalanyl-tRNA--protein transferase [Rhodoferax sp.]
MNTAHPVLPWLEPGEAFPRAHHAWGIETDAPGLLCAGGDLSVSALAHAYQAGIFPWFSAGQPVLWWSPDPRMVLNPAEFRLHPSLKKRIRQFARAPQHDIRVDSAFERVINACAENSRRDQSGTWIVPAMVQAYVRMHQAGLAHSVETWVEGQLVGGLYFVAIGRAVFGESMFHHTTDASKIALAALVCICRHWGINLIDCQQNTRHLTSLGAVDIPRTLFIDHVATAATQPDPVWTFSPLYWNCLLATQPAIT